MESSRKLEAIRALIPYSCEIVPAGCASAVFFYVPYVPFKSEPGVARVDSFYAASNLAYNLAGRYAEKLREFGIACSPNPEIDYKAAIGGSVGKNTLLYRKGLGSRFAIGAILLGEELPPFNGAQYAEMSCEGCDLCARACPLGAIGERFDRGRCMRQYMLRPEQAGEEVWAAFEDRILGCDICQRVCPMNSEEEQPMPQEVRQLLDYGNFVRSLKEGNLGGFAKYFGKNYARKNSLLAMFLICAANAEDKRFFELARQCARSDSFRVRAAAAYALKKLRRRREDGVT